MTKNGSGNVARYPGFRQWWAAVIVAVLIIAVFSGLVLLAGATAPKVGEDYEVRITGCRGTSMTAETILTARATTRADTTIRLKVEIEYRDLDGRLLDTDTAHIRAVAPGDTVVRAESTVIGNTASMVRRCQIVDVEASWA